MIDFFIVGAPKCGTTSLYEYLKTHPEIYLPEKKELHFFSLHELKKHCGGPGDKFVVQDCISNMEHLEALYDNKIPTQLAGDISPSYLFYPSALHKIKLFNPSAKIIIILRKQIEKAFSQYSHLYSVGRERMSFTDALEMENERGRLGYSDFWLYTESSLYHKQLKKAYDVFPRENIHVIFTEDLSRSPHECLKSICDFLAIDDLFPFTLRKPDNSSGKPKSQVLAKLLLAPNRFTSFLRRHIPQRLGRSVRRKLKAFNTGEKAQLDISAVPQRYLDLFEKDTILLESLLDREVPWK